MECDSDTLTLATAWTGLEDTVLRERNQTQGTKLCDSTSLRSRSGQTQRQEVAVLPGAGGGDGECVSKGDGGSVWADERVLEMVVGVVTQQRECA